MDIPVNFISRKQYLERIKPFIRKSIIKVLTGQRRVGKSYLLYQIIRHLLDEEPEANIIYLNFEDFALNDIREAAQMHSYIVQKLSRDRRNYIFIDEIQEVAEFEKPLRSLLLNPLNDIYITGSNAKMLSGELATHLSGRYIEIPVYSLSYLEFLEFHKLENSHRNLELYSRYGGLPYLANLPLADETAHEYLKSVYSTILYRDVVSRYNLRNSHFLETLVKFLAENVGNLFSAKNISDYLKSQHSTVSVPQIQSYIKYLSEAFLIYRAERYDIVGKRIFEIGEKYYFSDLGLRNITVGYRPSDKGKLIENLVNNHLLFCGYRVSVGAYRDKEIDFVAEKDNERVYIQAALRVDDPDTAQREFGNLLKIRDNYPKIVVSDEEVVTTNSYNGVAHWSLLQFLSEFK